MDQESALMICGLAMAALLMVGGVVILYHVKSVIGKALWLVVLGAAFGMPAVVLATNLFARLTEFQMYVVFPAIMDVLVVLGFLLVRRFEKKSYGQRLVRWFKKIRRPAKSAI